MDNELDYEELKRQYYEDQERSKVFKEAFNLGVKHAKQQIKYNKIISNLLLEFIGYEDEWLTTAAGYKKYTKAELIDIILKQRALMRTLFDKLEEHEKEKLKIKIEKFFWPVMHQDK
ncbi:hypothetical protein [Bacillus smithii]|uniref:hypothetical protein n=1 Tax=Bacillus smithii TaxID=1479 RepID=UPI002E1DB7F3|nr:hypothetical protein [Bacillus smithii]MED1456669.1 hypothetical protein [Bacillus smithii]